MDRLFLLLAIILLLTACQTSEPASATASPPPPSETPQPASATETATRPPNTSAPTPTETSVPPAPTPTPVPATASATPPPTPTPVQVVDEFGFPMVLVPAGPFVMGSQAGLDDAPPHTVKLDGYYIDQYEVTNAQFAVFLNEMGNQEEDGTPWVDLFSRFGHLHQVDGVWQPDEGYADHPAVEMTWHAARAYCTWRGARLPTEAEWEKAARGSDERTYPWGEEIDCQRANYRDCGIGESVPVGSYPEGASPYGVYDMAGNIAEWTGDWYGADYYAESPAENPPGPSVSRGDHVASRGGSWYSTDTYLRTFHRNHEFTARSTLRNVGIRCARSTPPDEGTGSDAGPARPLAPKMGDVRALVLMPDGYGTNYNLNRDNFELYGWDLTFVAANKSVGPCRSREPHERVDTLIAGITDVTQYDLLALMPANQRRCAYCELVESRAALDLVSEAVRQGLVVYAPCAGVRVLAAADVLQGRSVTGSSGFESEYEKAGAGFLGTKTPPVVDGNLVTAVRGLYNHVENCETIAVTLEGLQDNAASTGELRPVSTESQAVEQAGARWARTYGGPDSEGGRALAQTPDGGFIVAGYTYSFGAERANLYLLKTDPQGNAEWSQAYGGPGWEYGNSVALAHDGGYVVAGYTTSFGAGSRDVYLLKTDPQGSEEWSQTFGGPGVDEGLSVAQTDDGGYVVAGYTESFGAGLEDVYLIKVDAAGEETWSQTLGGEGPDRANSVAQTDDGGFILFGATDSYHTGNQDAYLLKTDPQGNEAWHQVINHRSSHPYDWGNAARQVSGGGYVAVGSNTASAPMSVFITKRDADGNEIWTSRFTRDIFYDYGNGLYEDVDGGYVIAGASKSSETGENDVYMIKVDPDGNKVWTQPFGGPQADWGSAVLVTPEGDYVVVGHTNSYGAGAFDVWLIRFSAPNP